MGNDNITLSALLELSIDLELAVSDLYLLYSEHYHDDRDFWWRLALEEKNHAAVLKSGRLFLQVDKLPQGSVSDNYAQLENVLGVLRERIERFKTSAPSMSDAYHYAHALECSAAEAHYQSFMGREPRNSTERAFQTLGREDRNHAQRIMAIIGTRFRNAQP